MGGESLVVVKDDDLVKVHVHTLKPGDALNIGQRYGEFVKLKIENMQEQHSHIINKAAPLNAKQEPAEEKPQQKYGLIAVAAGNGVCKLFKDLGVDVIVSGGQTMNPSTEDFVKVIKDLSNCENVFILPNNSNIILAAQQAKTVCEDRNVYVLETKSIQAGLSAAGMFDRNADVETNITELKDVIANVLAASVTYAIKDTTYEGVEVKEGDYMAIANKGIVACEKDRLDVMLKLLDYLFSNEDKDLITVIVGENRNDDEVARISKYIEDNSSLECEIIDGNQPVYSYLVGLE